jgi:AcrR family transcriptional regulator
LSLAEGEARARPGRPSSGARERILEACLETLKESGLAGLSIAKVADRAGESKALISYHFGSKDGLISAAAADIGREITAEILGGLEGATSIEEVITGSAAGLWQLLDHDERMARVYFDLNAVSVVDPGVRESLRAVKDGWRSVLAELLRNAGFAGLEDDLDVACTLIVAGLEGLCLERIERGPTSQLERARDLFISSTAAAIDPAG